MKTPVHITPARASKTAIRAIEKLGGSVFCKYYNPLAIRDCIKGNTERTQAAPTKKTDICQYLTSKLIQFLLIFFYSVVYLMEEQRLSLNGSTFQNASGRGALEGAFQAATCASFQMPGTRGLPPAFGAMKVASVRRSVPGVFARCA